MRALICAAALLCVAPVGPAVAAEDPAPIAALLAGASPQRGAQVFQTCGACHRAEPGGGHGIGPNLWNVFGREAAGAEGFDYSPALRALEGDWDAPRLNRYLHDPQSVAPGTRMVFPGIKDDRRRADLIAYLRTLSDASPPAAGAAPAPSTAGDSDAFGSSWPEGRGRETAGYACSACHSLAIVKQQGLSRERWDELLEWMVEEQGMTPLKPERRELVLDYLAEHFNQE